MGVDESTVYRIVTPDVAQEAVTVQPVADVLPLATSTGVATCSRMSKATLVTELAPMPDANAIALTVVTPSVDTVTAPVYAVLEALGVAPVVV